jgi:hypothetical protein
MLRARGWKTPSTMKAQLGSIHLVEQITQYGRAATLLDYFALPFVRAHPRAAPPDGGRNTVKEETLKHLVREGKLSKAMGLARMKHDAEERGLNTTARPTKAQIERTVADKFPGPPEDAEAIPTHAELPVQNWRTGEVNWGAGTAEEQAALKRKFGGQSTGLREEDLKKTLGRLCKQKAAGVDTTTNVFLRRAFRDGDADTFGTVLYPFASILAGTIHQEAMAFLLASRLALVPKADGEAPGPGAARQPPDFRPLGIGGSIMRLISTAVCNEDGSAIGHALAPLQVAVRITDGTCIMAALAQATFTAGRGGAGGADVLKTDLKNAYGTVWRSAILRGLYRYAPQLVRWFVICYGGPSKLFHSVHGFVGWVRTGVKQGDPMATIFFAVALQQAIIDIDRDVRDNQPDVATAGAMGFADDVDLFGDGERLLDNIVKYKAIIKDLTGMELCLDKCRLLLGRGIITQQLRDKADQHGIKIVTEGTTVMGAPVGTDQHIHARPGRSQVLLRPRPVDAAANVREPTPGVPPAHAGSATRRSSVRALR